MKIGTACEVYSKKGKYLKDVYYGYTVSGNHYFYNTKTEAVASRSGVGSTPAQNYVRFKIKDI